MEPVGWTAHWVAAARARASRREGALFHDPFAASLAGEEGERWLEGEDRERVVSYIEIRTRFFDEELERAASAGTRQIVIVAAGLDARAYRVAWPEGTRVFELDQPEVLAHKGAILDALRARPTCDRAAIGVDLRLPFEGDLRASGFRSEAPSAWLVEGLLPYLQAGDVTRLFARVASLSAAGSALAFDCVGVDAFSAPAFAAQAEALALRGIRMPFACEDPVALLSPFGFAACRSSFREVAARWGRGADTASDPLFAHLVAARRLGASA